MFVISGFNLWNNIRPIRLITLTTIIVLARDTAVDPRGVIFHEKRSAFVSRLADERVKLWLKNVLHVNHTPFVNTSQSKLVT